MQYLLRKFTIVMEKPSIGNIQQNSRISAKLHEEEVNSKRASG